LQTPHFQLKLRPRCACATTIIAASDNEIYVASVTITDVAAAAIVVVVVVVVAAVIWGADYCIAQRLLSKRSVFIYFN